MKTKWFNINKRTKTMLVAKSANNLAEAWDKTLKKWEWFMEGYNTTVDGHSSCGLCNLYWFYWFCSPKCPIVQITGKFGCNDTPLGNWVNAPPKFDCNDAPLGNSINTSPQSWTEMAELEYIFLLLVKLATEEDGI